MDNYFQKNELAKQNIPVIFTDETNVYNKLKQKYITYKKGLFIYGLVM